MTLKVLILDDSADLRTIFSAILHNAGYETIECSDVASAREEILQQRPAILVIDGSIDDAAGWGLAQTLSSQPTAYPVRIVVLEEFELDSRRPAKVAVDKILRKPIDPRLLRDEINHLAGNAVRGAATGA